MDLKTLVNKRLGDKENLGTLTKEKLTVEEYGNRLKGKAFIENGELMPALALLDEKIRILNELVMQIRDCPAVSVDLPTE